MNLDEVHLIDRMRITNETLVPLIRIMREELGDERAYSMLRRAVGDRYRALARERATETSVFWRGMSKAREGRHVYHPIELRNVRVEQDEVDFDIVECEYAALFHELGEPVLGQILMCETDFHSIDHMPDVTLDRESTIMAGGTHCAFRYRLEHEHEHEHTHEDA